MSPAERLRAFVREKEPGRCNVMSFGDDCTCPLCDIDRLQALNERTLKHYTDCLRKMLRMKEAAAELISFLAHNIDQESGKGGNIEIAVSGEKHADALCALINDLQQKLR